MSALFKSRPGRVLAVAAACFAVWQSAVLIRVLTDDRAGPWIAVLRDAGRSILGVLPWWAWVASAVGLVILAVLAWPAVVAMLPEIGEVAAEGVAIEMEGALGEEIAAEGIDIGTEGAMEEEIAAAQSRLEEMAAKVNPLDGSDNCSWAAREVDQALADMSAGRTPEPYAPDWLEPDMPDGSEMWSQGETGAPTEADMTYNKALEQEYGGTFGKSSMQQVAQQLEGLGNGARGIVRVAGDGVGHVFNAVNQGGEVFFVDGQSGAVWQSTDILPGTWGQVANTNIQFLLTAG